MKRLKGQEYKERNMKLFKELFEKTKVDFTGDDCYRSKKMLKLVVESKRSFHGIGYHSWWKDVIPVLAWMHVHNMDINDLNPDWFYDGDDYQMNVFDRRFMGSESFTVFFEAYALAKQLQNVINDNDYLADNEDVKLSKQDLLILLK